MAKTLDEILKRNDYKRLTSQLEDRTEEIAGRICQKMLDLDAEDTIIKIKGDISCPEVSVKIEYDDGWELMMDCRYFLDDDAVEYGDVWRSLERITAHDGARRPAALCFLNIAKQIIEKLGEIEEYKVKAVETALQETENL